MDFYQTRKVLLLETAGSFQDKNERKIAFDKIKGDVCSASNDEVGSISIQQCHYGVVGKTKVLLYTSKR